MKIPRIVMWLVVAITLAGSLFLIGVIIMSNIPLTVASANDHIIITGTPVVALDLWEEAGDITNTPIDYETPGRHRIDFTLQRGIRSADSHAYLYVLEIVEDIYIPIMSDLPDPVEFIANYDILDTPVDIRITSDIPQLDKIGTKTISFEVLEQEFNINIHVYDPYPPTADPVSIELEIGETASARQFLTNIFSYSPVNLVEFVEEPDFLNDGTQIIHIRIRNTAGNISIIEAELVILPNLIPPTITGVRDLTITRGGSLILRQGVQAFDILGEEVELVVDNGGLDSNTIGSYLITYTATDRWGNIATEQAYVNIVGVDVDWINNRIDEILAGITNPDMTQVQKARAIYNWVGGNVSYSATTRHPTDLENVNHALRFRTGNCFVFYSISEILLTRAGIPNRRVDRVHSGRFNHRWHLINPDNLGWHHFDTTPLNSRVAGYINRFMFTSSQAIEFTDIIQRVLGATEYYNYDRELFYDVVW